MSEDKWGRWTYQMYQGRNNIRVMIFSVYQVVDSAASSQGPLTAASQQRALLLAENDNNSPKEAFCRDLQAIVRKLQAEGHDIILTGDFNEVLGEHQGGITRIATECQLVDVMSAKHPNTAHPATFMRGRTRIDYVLTTPRVLDAVRYCEYEEFQQQIHTDHRTYYVDFDTATLFGTPLQVLAKFAARGLHSYNVKQNTRYIETKYSLLQAQNAFERSKSLNDPGDGHQFAERLDRSVVHASLAAEKGYDLCENLNGRLC
jgi:hypothetical protein